MFSERPRHKQLLEALHDATNHSTRTIPLTPYLAQLLASLPRAKQEDGTLSPFVFASTGKVGRIADTRASHTKALLSAGSETFEIPDALIRGG